MLALPGSLEQPCLLVSSLPCKTFWMVKEHAVLRCARRAALARGAKRHEGGVRGNGHIWAAAEEALALAAETGLSGPGLRALNVSFETTLCGVSCNCAKGLLCLARRAKFVLCQPNRAQKKNL